MDANEHNADLLSDFLAKEGYDPVAVTDIEATKEAFADASQFVFAIIDIDRFTDPVWPYCEQLNENDVPFIILSGFQNPTLRQESRDYGAEEFVDKPIPKQQFRDLIQTALGE